MCRNILELAEVWEDYVAAEARVREGSLEEAQFDRYSKENKDWNPPELLIQHQVDMSLSPWMYGWYFLPK